MQTVLLRFPQLKADDVRNVMEWLHDNGIPFLARHHYSMSMSTGPFRSRRTMMDRISVDVNVDIDFHKPCHAYFQLDFLIRESDEALVRLKFVDLYGALYYENLERILSGNQHVEWRH